MMLYLIIGELIVLNFLFRETFVDACFGKPMFPGTRPWHIYFGFAVTVFTWPLMLALGLIAAIISAPED